MKKSASQFVPGLGILLLAAVLLGAVGYFLHDFHGVQLGVAGALLWTGGLLVSFVLGTIYISRVLLPIPGNIGWTEAFKLLWNSYFSGVTSITGRTGRSESDPDENYEIPEVAVSFKSLGAGMLPSHEAAAIVRGNSYVRADGPGLVFLRSGESIAQIFDLRPHIRYQQVEANTRDGLPLETPITVVFQVRRPAREVEEEDEHLLDRSRLPYPYDKDAIFRLHYFSSVAEEDEIRPWTEHVCPRGATLLVTELGKLTIDELSEEGGTAALTRVEQSILVDLNRQFSPSGIEVIKVGIGPMKPPADVVEQYLTTWHVGWQSRVNQEFATGDAEAMRLMQQARAQAQIEIIDSVVKSIETVRNQSDVELHEIVMNRLIELMETTVSNENVRAIAPPPLVGSLTLEASSEMRESIEEMEPTGEGEE